MKRLAALALVLAAFGAARCDDSPTDPDDDTVVFTASLTSSNEVPPVSNSEAGATGSVTITFDLDRSGNTITAATANFSANVANMPAGSNLIMAHIHTGVAGVAGAIVVDTTLAPSAPIAIVNGAATLTRNNVTANAATVQAIIDNPSAFYFNIHSTLNPGGVVRGQLVRQGS